MLVMLNKNDNDCCWIRKVYEAILKVDKISKWLDQIKNDSESADNMCTWTNSNLSMADTWVT